MSEIQVVATVAGLAVASIALVLALIRVRAAWRDRMAWSRSAARMRDKH